MKQSNEKQRKQQGVSYFILLLNLAAKIRGPVGYFTFKKNQEN